ncbi:MAG: trans-aconitate 2-methyltransferase [Methyloligellaceae bacterium]
MGDWDAPQYMKFEDERTRPAADLLARVPVSDPKHVVDLGCGPGNSTELLVHRFPQAQTMGVDNSPDMVAKARARLPDVRFEEADIGAWQPQAPVDLLYSNAVLHWLPDHATLFPKLAAFLETGGCLAVQMPDTLGEDVHLLAREVAANGPWSGKLASTGKARATIASFEDTYAWLSTTCSHVDIWQTIYVHPLDGAEAIVAWIKSTGLRPFLDPLDADEQAAFLDRYTVEIADAYPRLPDGKALLRFPRRFVVAVR